MGVFFILGNSKIDVIASEAKQSRSKFHPKFRSKFRLKFQRLCHCPSCVFYVIPQLDWGISFKISFKIPLLRERILNFSEVLGAAAPKCLGRSPHKICELDLSSLKASKNLEFLVFSLFDLIFF